MTDMIDQQDRAVAPSLSLSPDLTGLFLPPDFMDTLGKWVFTARTLLEHSPNINIKNPEHARVVDALGRIVQIIDNAVETIDLSDARLPQGCFILLRIQLLPLQTRFRLLLDPQDLRRAFYTLEILPQLCDPKDADLSRKRSGDLDHFLGLATRWFYNAECPSELRFTRLLDSLGISDFIAQAKSSVERATSISHNPTQLSDCSPQSRIIQDLDQVIVTVDTAVECCDPSDQDREVIARLRAIQVVALQTRFRLLGSPTDLERSVLVSKIVSQFRSSASDSSNPFALHAFAFTPFESPQHFDAKIAIGEEMLRYLPQEARLLFSSHLASLLLRRCIDMDTMVDGERVLQLCEDTLPFVTEDYHARWTSMRTIAMFHLSVLGRQFPCLSKSLELFDSDNSSFLSDPEGPQHRIKAVFLWTQLRGAAVSGNEQAAISAFNEIHTRGYTRSESALEIFRHYSEADILHTIEALRKMCSIRSQEETFKPFAVVLILALVQQYQFSEDPQYTREAVSLRSRLGRSGLYGFDILLYMIPALGDYNGVERRPELTKAISTSSKGQIWQFPETPGWKSTPGRRDVIEKENRGRWKEQFTKYFNSRTGSHRYEIAIAHAMETAHLRNNDDASFHITLRHFLLRLSDSKGDSKEQRSACENLGNLYSSRYNRQHDVEDLKHAVDWYAQGVNTLGDDENIRAWRLRVIWANRLFDLDNVTDSIQYPCLLQAHDYIRQAAASTHNAPDARLRALIQWMCYIPSFALMDVVKHAPEICELALTLLEEQNQAASSPRLAIIARHEKKVLGEMLIRFTVLAGANGLGMAKAIECIEAFQALVWGQLHRLRVPLGDLEAVSPTPALRFQELSRRLESRMGLLDRDPGDEGADPLGTDNWRLNQDMNRVIEKIRALPGFERFLQRRLFGEDELRDVAKDGPVIILLDKNKAVILPQDGCTLFPLPLSYDAQTLGNLHKSLRYIANARDAHDEPDFAEGSISIGTHPVTCPSNSTGNSRSLRKGGCDTLMLDLLAELWKYVVEPVLSEILGFKDDGKGKLRTNWRTANEYGGAVRRNFLSCRSMLLGSIEAAHQSVSPTFFVSSYTPTLTALLDARARPIPPDVKVLAAAQPNPGGGWSRLAQVKDELKEIVGATPPAHLISLGDTDQPDFEGVHATVENVLKKLPDASVLHLACHGTQNPMDPLSSGFILANAKKLTIEELMKHRFPNAHTAILSACHTASNDVEQPDEAINLSSALMFLGFSSILGTKWPMYDPDGPVVAKAVYEALFHATQLSSQELTGTEAASNNEHCLALASFSLARVVDSIARHLRLEKKAKPERWATFVHVGI